MKKIIVTSFLLFGFITFAQEHFSGISTSNRVGILNGVLNPAEFSSLSKKFEINFYGLSFDVSNNKIGFKDLTSNTNLEDLLFTGTAPVNMRVDATIIGPSFAMRWMKWGFGLTTKANVKFDMVDVDPTIGNAISNTNLVLNTTLLNNPNNQRLDGTSYGTVGFSAARTIIDNDKYSFSAGITLNMLFPGSYSNFGLSNLNGTITENASGAYLTTNQPATLNIAYSGSLADSFTNFNDYSQSIFGKLNGLSTDIGVNYEWKDGKSNYKIKGGLAIKNMGSMTFKDNNNHNTNYTLDIHSTPQNLQGLDLSLFNNVNNLSEVEQVLFDKGYLNISDQNKTDFKVSLPTLLTLYADFKIVPKVYVTGYLQQKMKKDESNAQITARNIFSVTPRINLGFFEAYLPVSQDEISGTNVGFGFRLAGFYLGSNSIITSLADGKQANIYTGYRLAFL
ncbi:hypothetical protein QWY90_09085 [Flavobacterium paronense]|uniref:DUF5723 domain-containing protein n=1 Tax=Flavobacterium paronense TaxID=1392775 RepID=A0ABV5GBE5_9FLAO|nr:hypothetical protein [Flavobacterium paronense]MDN3677472.1 hypothetical protein [Flavobacterium paronense]